MRGWPPHEVEPLGRWLLRASDGVGSGRANSGLAVGDPGVGVEQALERVRGWYRARGLPAVVALPRPGCEQVEAAAVAAGWSAGHDLHVLVADLPAADLRAADLAGTGGPAARAAGLVVRLDDRPDEEWFTRSRSDVEALGPGRAPAGERRGPAAGLRVGPRLARQRARRRPRGAQRRVARGVLASRRTRRRAGAGWPSGLLSDVLAWGVAHGAHASYLQVRATQRRPGSRALRVARLPPSPHLPLPDGPGRRVTAAGDLPPPRATPRSPTGSLKGAAVSRPRRRATPAPPTGPARGAPVSRPARERSHAPRDGRPRV